MVTVNQGNCMIQYFISILLLTDEFDSWGELFQFVMANGNVVEQLRFESWHLYGILKFLQRFFVFFLLFFQKCFSEIYPAQDSTVVYVFNLKLNYFKAKLLPSTEWWFSQFSYFMFQMNAEHVGFM